MPSKLPQSPEEITRDYLQQVIVARNPSADLVVDRHGVDRPHASSPESDGPPLTVEEWRLAQTENPGTSGASLRRIEVRLTHTDKPLHLVLKIGGTGREARFYQSVAAQLPIETPRVYDARLLDDGAPWVLMEEVPGVKDGLRWTPGDYRRVVEDMAAFHARYWGREEELAAIGWLEAPTPANVQRRVDKVRADLDAVAGSWVPELLPDVYRPERLSLMRSLLDQPAWLNPLLHLGCTLVHGDYWFHNVLITSDGRRVLVDWDSCLIWSGLWELAYFLNLLHAVGGGAWREELPVSEADASAWYRAALGRHGVAISQADFERGMVIARVWQPLAHWTRQNAVASTMPRPTALSESGMHFMRVTFDRWEEDARRLRSFSGG